MTAKPRLKSTSIEALEDRIAPALLVYGANLLGGDSPSTGETSAGGNSLTLVKVISGRALVWFNGTAITGISVGPGTQLDITGDVFGDIVGNLEADGTLSDSDNDPTNGEDGGKLLPNSILGIATHPLGDQDGTIINIVTGGAISNLKISGDLFGIYAGDGVFRSESFVGGNGTFVSNIGIDINPVDPSFQGQFSIKTPLTPEDKAAAFLSGASIQNVKIDTGRYLQVFAGNGFTNTTKLGANGANGGSISNLTLDNALADGVVPAYHLLAGDGSAGKKGGAGGSISNVIEATSVGVVKIQAGNGGGGLGAAGGVGGSITNLDLQGSSSQYDVRSGNGGDGTPGGNGGRIANANFSNRSPVSGVILTADYDKDGYDDVLVADAGTGQMELSLYNSTTGGYDKKVQYVDQSVPIYLIESAGSIPVDGIAKDIDGDGDVDALILYKDGTMAAYLNQYDKNNSTTQGSFYADEGNGFVVQTVVNNTGFKATKFAEVIPGGSFYSVAENTDGKGILHGVVFGVTPASTSFTVFPGTLKSGVPIVDLARDYVAYSDGTIRQFEAATVKDLDTLVQKQAFNVQSPGGINDIDINEGDDRLMVLTTASRTIELFDITGTKATSVQLIQLGDVEGKPIKVKFFGDNNPNTNDQNDIVVLSNTLTKAVLTEFLYQTPTGTPPIEYLQGISVDTSIVLKEIAPAYLKNASLPSFAGISGSLNQFTVISGFANDTQYPLDFSSKQVNLVSGNGGKGNDAGTKFGKGGNGGEVVNVNIDAQKITIAAGNGGNSTNGQAGNGGSISNAIAPVTTTDADGNSVTLPGSFISASGVSIIPRLQAELLLTIAVGDGGTPTGSGGTKAASGGAGGSMVGLDITLNQGPISLQSGTGGDGKGGVGGAGGDIRSVNTVSRGGDLTVRTGSGGATTGAGNAGSGGSVVNLNYSLALDADGEKNEVSYSVTVLAGNGGEANDGIGGAGGRLERVTLTLDGPDRTFDSVNPNLSDTHLDSTVVVVGRAGAGGDGGKAGGTGGSILSFAQTMFFDQVFEGGIVPNYGVLSLEAGVGGDVKMGKVGNGGSGGSVSLSRPISGLTRLDPDRPGATVANDPDLVLYPSLVVIGGDGGSGTVRGGAGGSVAGLVAQNAVDFSGRVLSSNQLYGAFVKAGDGGAGATGDGGAGGSVKDSLVGVYKGMLEIFGGDGGASNSAKGGIGGGVAGCELGLVNTYFGIGLEVAPGSGGNGATQGGAGGDLKSIRINTPQSIDALSALLKAGPGGNATTAAGAGGKGGSIDGVTQAKDFNSTINLIEAGAGGNGGTSGKGGVGGNVANVRTVGFLGRPSDAGGTTLGVFDQAAGYLDDDRDPTTPAILAIRDIAQGVYAGKGGTGQTVGLAGFVNNVTARQIAAIAATPDLDSGLFSAASKVTNVKAAVIAYDVDGDKQFDASGGIDASPKTTIPVDGFVLADAIANVLVNGTLMSASTDRKDFLNPPNA